MKRLKREAAKVERKHIEKIRRGGPECAKRQAARREATRLRMSQEKVLPLDGLRKDLMLHMLQQSAEVI